MTEKALAYAQMAEDTARQITGSYQDWTSFLRTAARLYKYPYHEQLMIYAQRPDATACASFDLWNNTMRRYVRRGSKGIALVDTSTDIPRIHYVFEDRRNQYGCRPCHAGAAIQPGKRFPARSAGYHCHAAGNSLLAGASAGNI